MTNTVTAYLKAINGGRVHAVTERRNRFGELALCGKALAYENARYDAATCKACLRIEGRS